jgi:hypothetical protein
MSQGSLQCLEQSLALQQVSFKSSLSDLWSILWLESQQGWLFLCPNKIIDNHAPDTKRSPSLEAASLSI